MKNVVVPDLDLDNHAISKDYLKEVSAFVYYDYE